MAAFFAVSKQAFIRNLVMRQGCSIKSYKLIEKLGLVAWGTLCAKTPLKTDVLCPSCGGSVPVDAAV